MTYRLEVLYRNLSEVIDTRACEIHLMTGNLRDFVHCFHGGTNEAL